MKLEKLFSDEELITITYSIINDYLKVSAHYTQSIDRTIDELYLMYTESAKTRYILLASCAFTLLKQDRPEEYMQVKKSITEHIIQEKRGSHENPLLNWFNKISKDQILRLDSSNNEETTPHIQTYIRKLIEELEPLLPRNMSDRFKSLNLKLLDMPKTTDRSR
ncbi:hypothetical protein [Cohnella soli]